MLLWTDQPIIPTDMILNVPTYQLELGDKLLVDERQCHELKEAFLTSIAKISTANQLLPRKVESQWDDESEAHTFTVLLYTNEFNNKEQEEKLRDHPDWQRWLPADASSSVEHRSPFGTTHYLEFLTGVWLHVHSSLLCSRVLDIVSLASSRLGSWWKSDFYVEAAKP